MKLYLIYSLCFLLLVIGTGVAKAGSLPEFHGYIRQDYQARFSEGEEDQDLFSYDKCF